MNKFRNARSAAAHKAWATRRRNETYTQVLFSNSITESDEKFYLPHIKAEVTDLLIEAMKSKDGTAFCFISFHGHEPIFVKFYSYLACKKLDHDFPPKVTTLVTVDYVHEMAEVA